MSTHSNIGIENEDGSVTYVYCHFDGYPSGVGEDVVDMSRREARALINGGDMSCVGEPYSARGESCPPKTATSIEAYHKAADNDCTHYTYLINRHGTWKFKAYGERGWRSLKQELKSSDRDDRED